MVTMLAHLDRLAQDAPSGTLGGSALASWTPFWGLVGAFAAIVAALFVIGRPSPRPWPMLQPLSRIPGGLTRITGIPGWAAVAIGTALYGLLVAGQGFYSDVAWHIALGRDEQLMTAPHAGILLGLVMILGVGGPRHARRHLRSRGGRSGSGRCGSRARSCRSGRSGLGAVSGFPLDEVWHHEYGIDVTMWSPTHMLMILGATFTGLAAWLVLAEAGVAPTDGRWAPRLPTWCAAG